MRRSGVFWIALLLLAAMSISGCDLPLDSIFGEGAVTPDAVSTTPVPSTPATPVASHGGPTKDYVSLIDNLRAAGVTVEPTSEEVEEPFFSVQGRPIKVNG